MSPTELTSIDSMRFATLFATLWIGTIAVYAPKIGIVTAMKFGIITSISKAVIARAHHWGWDKYVVPKLNARKERKAKRLAIA